MTKKGFFRKHEYVYDEYYDCCICPANKVLSYSTTNREGYREYKNNLTECRYVPKYKEIYRERKETIERVFADAKERHGLRYATMRGLAKVKMQVTLIFACMNLKKIAV